MRRSLVCTGAAFVFGMVLFLIAIPQADAYRLPSGETITIDGNFSDWNNVPNFITDSNPITNKTTYYWNTATGAWQTTDPGYAADHVSYEDSLDLRTMKMAHDDTHVYFLQEFVQPMFSYTNAAGYFQPFDASRPAPAAFDHKQIFSFDIGRDGDYDYYVVPSTIWVSGATNFSQLSMHISLYRDANNGAGWDSSDALVISLSNTVAPNDGSGAMDNTGQNAKMEMKEPRSILFNYIPISDNQPFNVRYEAHSTAVKATSAAEYTLSNASAVNLSNPKSFTVKPASRSVGLRWTKSDSLGTTKYRVMRQEGSAPADPWAGTQVYEGTKFSHRDTGLTNNTKYYYKVFAMDGNNNYSDGVTRIAVPNKLTVVTAPAIKGAARVRAYYGLDGKVRPTDFYAYPKNLVNTGADVAAGDIDGDGKAEIVAGTGRSSGRGCQIRMFEHDGTIKGQFTAYDNCGGFGTDVAVGDVDKDGKAEIVTMMGNEIKVFRGTGKLQRQGFNIFRQLGISNLAVRSMALGDVDGDGAEEIIVGIFNANSKKSEVRMFEYWGDEIKFSNVIQPYGMVAVKGEGGSVSTPVTINVAGADVDGDGTDEIVTMPANYPGTAYVKVYEPNGAAKSVGFYAFSSSLKNGGNVSAGDIDADGKDEIVIGTGGGLTSQVRAFEYNGTPKVLNVQPYGVLDGGVNLAVGTL